MVWLSERGAKDNPWIESFLVHEKEEKLFIPWRSNLKRRHSRLDYQSPTEYKKLWPKTGSQLAAL